MATLNNEASVFVVAIQVPYLDRSNAVRPHNFVVLVFHNMAITGFYFC